MNAGAGSRPLHLASVSPRRQELLRAAGIPFVLVAPGAEEAVDVTGLSPRAEAQCKARHKALHADAAVRSGIVLAADTVVALGPRALNKAADRDEARAMLTALAGVEHEVFTAVAVLDRASGRLVEGVDAAQVWFRPLTPAAIDAYLDTGEWRDRAGAYAIQGHAARLVARMAGDLETVVGLPTKLVRQLLAELGGAP